jgi:hypothetical protein
MNQARCSDCSLVVLKDATNRMGSLLMVLLVREKGEEENGKNLSQK